ncbi:hypothetical protein ISR8_1753 [Streptococcus pyogenes]|nr:hypothetical protein SPYAA216_0877 [Streptococcus pyogenes AA216]KGE60207.1 hypothetical protein MGAS2111_0948 [Streptococcus pyogenes MGAS2111]CCG27266.1 hypothetical protein [Streptococcus pyogenes NS88.2]SDV86377.1 hypothetical protein ISR7_0337 [Streptococcus pyogenes]BAC64071.1 hypothetical protein [Streptococcus pyogenes SSI-1]
MVHQSIKEKVIKIPLKIVAQSSFKSKDYDIAMLSFSV